MIWSPNPDLYPRYLRPRILRGLGLGEKLEYKAWLKIREVGSKGFCGAVRGILIERPYELFSNGETIFFYLTERRPNVIDIRENWPILDLARTVEICSQLGVRHVHKGLYPWPFTIDALITEQTANGIQYVAASIKTAEDARDPDVRKRLTVEYLWCKENGIDWILIDTSGFTDSLHSTLRFMRRWYQNRYEPAEPKIAAFLAQFGHVYQRNVLLKELLETLSAHTKGDPCEVENLFTYCAWKGLVPISLKHPLRLDRPVVLTGVPANG